MRNLILITVSFVASAEYMADNIDWGLKIGAFIPLNVVIKERK